VTREESLEHLLGFYSPDPSVWERPDELPRWAAAENDGRKNHWIAFFDTEEEALAYFGYQDGGWMPGALVDLDTGQAYDVVVTCTRGKEMSL
jgi:hypothetical protein